MKPYIEIKWVYRAVQSLPRTPTPRVRGHCSVMSPCRPRVPSPAAHPKHCSYGVLRNGLPKRTSGPWTLRFVSDSCLLFQLRPWSQTALGARWVPNLTSNRRPWKVTQISGGLSCPCGCRNETPDQKQLEGGRRNENRGHHGVEGWWLAGHIVSPVKQGAAGSRTETQTPSTILLNSTTNRRACTQTRGRGGGGPFHTESTVVSG